MPRVIRRETISEPMLGSALLESLGPDRPKKKFTPGRAKSAFAKASEQLSDVLKNPKSAEPKHLVALYARLHEEVYGAFPEELRQPKDWSGACSAARRLIDEAFDGDPARAIEFMRWVWQKQRTDVKRKRAHGETPFRVGWRYQFVARNLVTDYRVAMQSRTR